MSEGFLASLEPVPNVAWIMLRSLIFIAGLFVATGCDSGSAMPTPIPDSGSTPRHAPVVIASYPHDSTAFTQGLEWWGPYLVEGTGIEGKSNIRITSPQTGQVVAQYNLPPEIFGEGITVRDDTALQISWSSQELFAFDLSDDDISLQNHTINAYEGEGWGICYDGDELAMSNGSDKIQFRRWDTFVPTRSIKVRLDGAPVDQLNELECASGLIWANVWKTSIILAIDPETGVVRQVIDAKELTPEGLENSERAVLNGIAFNPETEHFWLTGKFWPVMYEVAFPDSPTPR